MFGQPQSRNDIRLHRKKVKKKGGHSTTESPRDDGVEFMDILLRHQRRDEEDPVISLLYSELDTKLILLFILLGLGIHS